MSLYVRLFTGFWSHRKTAKLRMILGDDALWLVPRIWCYAAENQPDGDFSAYSAAEIAMLLAYASDAQAMLQALQDSGFMDGMKIHDWEQYNDFHSGFSARAKKAAEARWAKEKKNPHTPKEKKKKEDMYNDRESEQALGKQCLSIKHTARAVKTIGTLSDLIEFCSSEGLEKRDAEYCFNKWESNGWKIGTQKIKDWKCAIRSWRAQGYLPSTKNGASPHKTERNRAGFDDWPTFSRKWMHKTHPEAEHGPWRDVPEKLKQEFYAHSAS